MFPGSMVPWFHGSMVQWFNGSMVPWFHGSMVQWFHGSMVPWFHGSMVPWFLGSLFLVDPLVVEVEKVLKSPRDLLKCLCLLGLPGPNREGGRKPVGRQ